MTSRLLLLFGVILLGSSLLLGAYPAAADSSHARIIRLSLVQGDVRFTRDAHGDPLADEKAVWETAVLNLPIRQGYILATDHGRAEVEFENGAMAFLNENTVLEFYDLSLEDGARTTRLVLRQGSVSVYVNPSGDDYFSVTGGDFTVEAAGRTSFRLDNFDDGSTVNVSKGHINVLHKKSSTPLEQGQSLSMRAGDEASLNVGRLPDNDDFDRWVSGRVDSVVTATTAAMQYTSAPYTYSSGFADLYTYGSWFPVSGYGYCWRPYGVGMGWSPFSYGNWFYDPFFGWTFLGNQPWGWLPFHYGGWIFQPGFGFLWSPFGFGGVRGPVRFRPVTGVFVHSGATLALVPSHPMDLRGRTPINLAQGAFPVSGGRIAESMVAGTGGEWKSLKQPPREALSGTLAASARPERLSRTVLASNGNTGARVVTFSRYSSIVYDPQEHRFVNNTGIPVENKMEKNSAVSLENQRTGNPRMATSAGSVSAPGLPEGAGRTWSNTGANRVTETPRAGARTTTSPPVPRAMTPPPPSRSFSPGGERGGSGGGSYRGGSAPSHPSAPAPRPSAPSGRPH